MRHKEEVSWWLIVTGKYSQIWRQKFSIFPTKANVRKVTNVILKLKDRHGMWSSDMHDMLSIRMVCDLLICMICYPPYGRFEAHYCRFCYFDSLFSLGPSLEFDHVTNLILCKTMCDTNKRLGVIPRLWFKGLGATTHIIKGASSFLGKPLLKTLQLSVTAVENLGWVT